MINDTPAPKRTELLKNQDANVNTAPRNSEIGSKFAKISTGK